MPRSDRLFWRGLAVGIATLLLGACGVGLAPQARVALERLDTDVVFGAGAPSPAPAASPAPPVVPGPLPSLQFPSFSFPTIGQIGGVCPAAPPTAFPAVESPATVTTMPAAGQYRWAAGGTWQLPVLTTHVDLPLPGTFSSVLRNVQRLQDPMAGLPGAQPELFYSYELIQPDFSNAKGYWDYHFQVKTDAQEGDPEGGLALKEIDHYDSNFKNPQQAFVGEPALLLLPLPVSPGPVGVSTPLGNQGEPTSVDTSGSGNAMSFNGKVGARERVDACGTPVQAWPVDGTLTNGSGQATVHLDVATQWGAMLVTFDIDGSWLGTTYTKATQKVGQAPPPEEIPAEFR